MGTRVPYGITQCYLPSSRDDIPALTPAGTRLSDPEGMQGWVDLVGWLHTRSLMNRYRTGQGSCHDNLHKKGLAQSPSCDCGQQQTMNHTVNTCPFTKFEGRLYLLHEPDDDAVIWLESTATAALAKQINNTEHCFLYDDKWVQMSPGHWMAVQHLNYWSTAAAVILLLWQLT